MNITLRMAWRNLWRHRRRTWLTVGAMIFSNIILVFLISLQLGMYGMMINNTLRAQTAVRQLPDDDRQYSESLHWPPADPAPWLQ